MRMPGTPGLPWSWGATEEETRSARRGVDRISIIRALSVQAPPPVVFRWLCQLKVAPYSYDLLDNWGRRSPRTLTPGVEVLTVDEPVMGIFTLVDFVNNEYLTLRMADAGAVRLFGAMDITYRVRPTPEGSRLTCVLDLPNEPGPLARGRRYALAWGDLVMMRRQLLNFRDLSEQSLATPSSPPVRT